MDPITRGSAGGGHGAASLRLTRRGRAVALCGALAVAGALGVGGLGTPSAEAGQPRAAVAVEEHTVAPGETLWQIARGVTAPGQDVRDTVVELQQINGLQSATLLVGQQILVPSA